MGWATSGTQFGGSCNSAPASKAAYQTECGRVRGFVEEGRFKMSGWVWAVAFLILATVAGAIGFAGIAGTATWIVQVLFFVSVIAFIETLLWGRRGL